MRKRSLESFSETRKRTHGDSDAKIPPKRTKKVDIIEYLRGKKREKRNYEKLS